MRVQACNAIGCGPWSAERSARTDDPPSSIRVSHGRSAVGQPGCSAPASAFLHGTLQGLSPNTTYQFDCFGNGSQFDTGTFTARTNGSGDWEGDLSCYYGYPGHSVHFTANGQRSNTITW